MNILSILQICDTSFPIGSFNHSFGMETYIRDGVIKDTKTFKTWLDSYLKFSFTYNDALALKLVYEYIDADNLEFIWILDSLLFAQSIAKETKEASRLIGQRMLKTLENLYSIPLLKLYEAKIQAKELYGNQAIVFAILMKSLGISLQECILSFSYSNANTLVQNAIRAIPLGQKDGQIVLKQCFEEFHNIYNIVQSLSIEDLGASTPGIEISQINHQNLHFRLFMS